LKRLAQSITPCCMTCGRGRTSRMLSSIHFLYRYHTFYASCVGKDTEVLFAIIAGTADPRTHDGAWRTAGGCQAGNPTSINPAYPTHASRQYRLPDSAPAIPAPGLRKWLPRAEFTPPVTIRFSNSVPGLSITGSLSGLAYRSRNYYHW
jgi:hypothetical protein